MKLFIGCDHASPQLKNQLIEILQSDHEVTDHGTNSNESCDYPDFAIKVAKSVQENSDSRGILICGSGIGMAIVANKFKGIRAGVIHNSNEAQLFRAHNNGNVLCLGARITTSSEIQEILKTWLNEPFEGGRHDRRLAKFSKFGS